MISFALGTNHPQSEAYPFGPASQPVDLPAAFVSVIESVRPAVSYANAAPTSVGYSTSVSREVVLQQ